MPPISRRGFLARALALAAGAALPWRPVGMALGAAPTSPPVIVYFPVDDSSTVFKDDYGVYAKGRRHGGVDLFAPKGTPVVAVADGFVEVARRGNRPGYFLSIRHADGWTSWYMHLDNDAPGTDNGQGGAARAFFPDVTPGAFVTAGQPIGRVGDSGNAEGTDPHVHFELHQHGSRRDPYVQLAAAMGRRLAVETRIDAPMPEIL